MEKRGAFVSGALGRLLHLTRFAGISPMLLVKHRDGWWISQSPFFVVYGYLLAGLFTVTTLGTVLIDLSIEMEHSIRSSTRTRRAVWVMDAVVVTALACHGVATAVRRGNTLISCLNDLHVINFDLNTFPWQKKSETRKCWLLFLWTLIMIVLTVADYGLLVLIIIDKNGDAWLCVMHSFYYLSYWVIQLQIYLFMLFTMHIRMSFKAINDKLKSLEKAMSPDPKKMQNGLPIFMLKKKGKRSVNSVIDSLAIGKVKTDEHLNLPVHETVRRLTLTYVSVCDVVREVDKRHGVWLIMLLGASLLHLVITPYYLIFNIFPGANDFTHGTLNTVLQMLFCVYHTVNLAMIIEPCHLTLLEVDRIRESISHLMLHTSSNEPLAAELDLFYRHLDLNRVAYAPLQITTLKRGLIITILGSITTYLAIVIQL